MSDKIKEVFYFMNLNDIDMLVLNLLNLKPNDIQDILSVNSDNHTSIIVTLKRRDSRLCPTCGGVRLLSQGYYLKSMKVSNEAFRNTSIKLRVPRYWCPDCGKSFSETDTLNPKNHTVSYDVIIRVMNLLQNADMTFARCAELTGVSESTVVRIFDKSCHVSRGFFPEAICVDEVYTKLTDFKFNGNYSKYSFLFYDFYQHQLIDVLPSRTKAYLHHYFQDIPYHERQNVKYVVMDMSNNYRELSKIYFKKAIICADSFHVIKMLNDSLSKLRVRIMKSYDSSSQEYYLLKHWNYLLFDRHINLDNTPKYNKKMGRYMNYRNIRDAILDINDSLHTAWKLKELYSDFNQNCDYDHATDQLQDILTEFHKADIPEYRGFCSSILNWRQEIINSFILYKGRRLNNSVAESINNRVSTLLFNTRGIRNNERRRKRIMYAINKLKFSIR